MLFQYGLHLRSGPTRWPCFLYRRTLTISVVVPLNIWKLVQGKSPPIQMRYKGEKRNVRKCHRVTMKELIPVRELFLPSGQLFQYVVSQLGNGCQINATIRLCNQIINQLSDRIRKFSNDFVEEYLHDDVRSWQ